MIQETLHGKWFREEAIDGENWVEQGEATIWIEQKEESTVLMMELMMGLAGLPKNPYVKTVEFDYEPPKPGEFE